MKREKKSDNSYNISDKNSSFSEIEIQTSNNGKDEKKNFINNYWKYKIYYLFLVKVENNKESLQREILKKEKSKEINVKN